MASALVRPGQGWLRAILVLMAVTSVLSATSAPLGAQGAVRASEPTAPGWVFTPGISVGETWDNNVLLATEGSETVGDFLTAVSPRGALGFRGRRSSFQADYRGSFQIYQQLTDLNAFDQRAGVEFRSRLSRTMNVFARNTVSVSPTTDDIDLPGIRFRRQGVILDDLRAGVEARLNPRTSLEAAYTFQWVNFDEGTIVPIDALRQGGHAHGAFAQAQYFVSPRLAVGGEFDLRHAVLESNREFDVLNAMGTVAWRVTERVDVSGGFGYAWLTTAVTGERRSAPSMRASASGSGARLAWNVGYRRSFLPSFGFGGTFQNNEIQGGILAPLTRRLDLSASASLRENEPLAATALDPFTELLRLRSIWIRSSISFLATRWMRVEGFYIQVFQDSRRAGGEIDRSRIGVQVVTSKRMRIR
jgi:uncharacterized protein (PEP-CTERM system associated)